MTKPPMTPDEEYDFYAQPENQEPQGPPRRRRAPLSDAIPVRFPPEMVEEIRRSRGLSTSADRATVPA